jgi:hypothetical protein
MINYTGKNCKKLEELTWPSTNYEYINFIQEGQQPRNPLNS